MKYFIMVIMDTVADLPFSENTLKVKKTTCTFPCCIILMNKALSQSVKIVPYILNILNFLITGDKQFQIYFKKYGLSNVDNLLLIFYPKLSFNNLWRSLLFMF